MSPEYAQRAGNAYHSGLTTEMSWTIYCPPERLHVFEEPIAEAKSLAAAEPYKNRVELIEHGVLDFIVTNCTRYHDSTDEGS